MSNKKTIVWKLASSPPWIRKRLGEFFENGEKVMLCFETDMNRQGEYAVEALVVTDQRVLAIAYGQEGVLREVPLSEVALIKTKLLMGNGLLLVTTWHQNVEMLRFSSTLSATVGEFKEEFEQYLMSRLAWRSPSEHEDEVEHKDEEESTADVSEQARRCPKCSQLLPADRDICRACQSSRDVMLRMLSYLRPYKPMLAVSLALTLLMASVACALPRLSRTLIDGAIGQGDLGLLRGVVFGLGALLLLRSAAAAIQRLVMTRLAQNVIYDLRREVYSHLQRLSMDYHDRQSTGRLISRVLSDTAQLQQFAVGQLQQFVVDGLMLVIVLCWMMSYSAKLTLMLWFPLPLFFLLVKWYHGNVHKVLRKAFRKRAAMSGHLGDTIPGIAMVKAFSQEERSVGEFNDISNSYRGELIKAVGFSARFVAAFMVLTQVGTVLVYWFGGKGTIQGSGFTLGQLVMFIGWIAMMYAPVWRFATLTEQFETASTSAERVFDVLDTEAVISKNEDGHKLTGINGCIRFEDVSFHYESGPPVLKNMSLEVKAGETIGVVGPSGSGKTTLIKLLCRFYDPTGGRIVVDDHDLTELNLASFRAQLAVVPQNPVLFRESILENIRYGKPDASREEVIRAARIANAHDFIMEFPEAYDTDAREQGSRFSGGEKQRICIARAVLKNPNLLILDEATSAVDTKNEKLIQIALDRLIQNRTTFIIAHRLSTLRNADRIIMMKDGRILDIGHHVELMARCEPYKELVVAQEQLGERPMLEVA
ncbi:MAG: ABC transporter ATP-binding protein [Candidatus Brocadiae bacterium]|nr:ABC transporter ATP-binding protein [Candidatus Brocadiia bacterium]